MLRQRVLDNLDVHVLTTTLALVGLGIVGIASASSASTGAWRLQLTWLFVAAAIAAVVVAIDYHLWAEFSFFLHLAVIALLVVVLYAGKEVGGNRSWLTAGPLTLQPSELAKWSTCLVLATYLSLRSRGGLGLRGLLEMGVLVGVPMALIAAQPDMGTALTFLPIYLAALMLGGLRWKVIVALLLVGLLLAPVAWILLEDYQRARILTVFDAERDPSGVGYQARQSKIAIGSGRITGKGLFQGTQSRLNFLPARHTDFILAVLSEDLGFLGAAAILSLFYYLFARGIAVARAAQDRLGTYICLLVVAWLAGQLAINAGMVIGVLPTIGVPLPLLSYGGSALVAAGCGIALILNVNARRFVNS